MSRIRILVALLALGIGACKDDPAGPGASDEPGSGSAVVMKGILVGSVYSGDLELTVAATGSGNTFPVTGCVYLSVATCTSVSGTYNSGAKALAAATGSPSLSFAGTYVNREIHGSFTGADSGEFVLINGTVTVYCGTFTGDASGTWNFTIAGSGLDGIYDDGSGPDDLTGSVSGNNVSITFSGGTATGTISGASASGGWTASPSSGTWSGSSSGCRS